VIFASVVTGGVEATLTTIISLIVGISRPLLIFPIIFIMSFVPVIGAAPVAIGIGLYQFFQGNHGAGILFLITALLIAIMDNFLRPQLLRGASNLHPLLGFVSALAGIQFFGMPGLFFGPVICGMMLETIKITHDNKAV